MDLYEVTNGYVGESYVRCYVWARSPQGALVLAEAAYQREYPTEPQKWADLKVKLLLSSTETKPFNTKVSDSGWEEV